MTIYNIEEIKYKYNVIKKELEEYSKLDTELLDTMSKYYENVYSKIINISKDINKFNEIKSLDREDMSYIYSLYNKSLELFRVPYLLYLYNGDNLIAEFENGTKRESYRRDILLSKYNKHRCIISKIFKSDENNNIYDLNRLMSPIYKQPQYINLSKSDKIGYIDLAISNFIYYALTVKSKKKPRYYENMVILNNSMTYRMKRLYLGSDSFYLHTELNNIYDDAQNINVYLRYVKSNIN